MIKEIKGFAIKHLGKFAVALTAVAIVALGVTTGAQAAVSSAHDIPEGSIYHYQINDAVEKKFIDVPVKGVYWASLNNGIVSEEKLSSDVKDKLNAVGTGEKGDTGAKGDQGANGDPGTPGAAGDKGDTGAAGQNGTNGVSGYEVIAKEVVLPAATEVAVSATCPEGKVAIGGGYKVDGANRAGDVFHNMGGGLTKTEAGTWIATRWDVKALGAVSAKTNVTAFVTCVNIQ